MDVTPEEEAAANYARDAVERLLRPQVEIAVETRAVAQQLAQVLGQDRLANPISLVDPDKPISLAGVPEGDQRRFIEAAQKSIRLQKELAALQAEHHAAASVAAVPPPPSADQAEAERKLLREQLEYNKLERERKRLEALKKFYDHMDSLPAAAPDFLDPEVMFKDCAPLPELPKELIEGFTKEEEEAPDHKIQELLSKLRKATLRQQLVLERDQRKLEELRAKHPINYQKLSPETQVKALSAVKNALVDWIEAMLKQAGEGEGEESNEGVNSSSPSKNNHPELADFDTEARLADIQKEYERHIELRKRLMSSMAQLRELVATEASEEEEKEGMRGAEPASDATAAQPPLPINPDPQTYLLTPYLEKLQSLAQEQKALVQEKAYINATMARQQQDANKTLQRLAQKSQLLAKFAPPQQQTAEEEEEKSHANSTFAEATKKSSSSSASITEQIQPWLFAADSAKIGTLEAVAEEVDKGQAFVEQAMESLNQVSMLQNKGPLQSSSESGSGNETSGAGPHTADEDDLKKKKTQKKSGSSTEKKDGKDGKDLEKSIWAMLDGNLGLINE